MVDETSPIDESNRPNFFNSYAPYSAMSLPFLLPSTSSGYPSVSSSLYSPHQSFAHPQNQLAPSYPNAFSAFHSPFSYLSAPCGDASSNLQLPPAPPAAAPYHHLHHQSSACSTANANLNTFAAAMSLAAASVAGLSSSAAPRGDGSRGGGTRRAGISSNSDNNNATSGGRLALAWHQQHSAVEGTDHHLDKQSHHRHSFSDSDHRFSSTTALGHSFASCSTNSNEFNNRKGRRERTSFSKEQLNILDEHFNITQYPDVVTREELAQRVGLAECRIQVWFKNKRAKFRANKKQEELAKKLAGFHQSSAAAKFAFDNASDSPPPAEPTVAKTMSPVEMKRAHLLRVAKTESSAQGERQPSCEAAEMKGIKPDELCGIHSSVKSESQSVAAASFPASLARNAMATTLWGGNGMPAMDLTASSTTGAGYASTMADWLQWQQQYSHYQLGMYPSGASLYGYPAPYYAPSHYQNDAGGATASSALTVGMNENGTSTATKLEKQ